MMFAENIWRMLEYNAHESELWKMEAPDGQVEKGTKNLAYCVLEAQPELV